MAKVYILTPNHEGGLGMVTDLRIRVGAGGSLVIFDDADPTQEWSLDPDQARDLCDQTSLSWHQAQPFTLMSNAAGEVNYLSGVFSQAIATGLVSLTGINWDAEFQQYIITATFDGKTYTMYNHGDVNKFQEDVWAYDRAHRGY